MIYKRNLSSNDLILLYLKEFINEISLCKKIINLKNKLEYSENIIYHINRWDSIAVYHYIIHDTHQGKFSYIFNNKNFIIKKDHRLEFYHNTGLSYQIIELIHELIKTRRELKIFNKETYKNEFKDEDKLYSILAKEIMIKMR